MNEKEGKGMEENGTLTFFRKIEFNFYFSKFLLFFTNKHFQPYL
jgi:hypothetical protein